MPFFQDPDKGNTVYCFFFTDFFLSDIYNFNSNSYHSISIISIFSVVLSGLTFYVRGGVGWGACYVVLLIVHFEQSRSAVFLGKIDNFTIPERSGAIFLLSVERNTEFCWFYFPAVADWLKSSRQCPTKEHSDVNLAVRG